MMKAAKDWSHSDLAEPLNGTKKRRILGEGERRPGVIVVGGICRKDPAQLDFAKDDDIIEAFPADRTDQPLRMPVLPR